MYGHFDRGSSNITQRTPIVNIKDNTFTYTVPALTACHIVLEAAEPVVYGDLNNDSKVNAVDINDAQTIYSRNNR